MEDHEFNIWNSLEDVLSPAFVGFCLILVKLGAGAWSLGLLAASIYGQVCKWRRNRLSDRRLTLLMFVHMARGHGMPPSIGDPIGSGAYRPSIEYTGPKEIRLILKLFDSLKIRTCVHISRPRCEYEKALEIIYQETVWLEEHKFCYGLVGISPSMARKWNDSEAQWGASSEQFHMFRKGEVALRKWKKGPERARQIGAFLRENGLVEVKEPEGELRKIAIHKGVIPKGD